MGSISNNKNSRKKEYDTKKKREYSIKLNELFKKVVNDKKNKSSNK